MSYIYETHLHTIEGSACSDTPAKDYIKHMQKIGYSGMIVTDHFFNGNSCINRELIWEDKVELYCKGYEHALEAAKDTDFQVFFGIEYNFEGDEYLPYGVDKKWLLANPKIMEMTRSELHSAVNSAGGIMIQAHPHRERGYLNTIHLAPNDVDGAEAYNAENPDWQNALGYQYSKSHNMLVSSGSDIHHLTQKHMGGMSFPYRLTSIHEYVKGFLQGDATPVFVRDYTAEGATFKSIFTEKALLETDAKPSLPVITLV